MTSPSFRSILISLGLDYNSSIDLRDSPEAASATPENGECTLAISHSSLYSSRARVRERVPLLFYELTITETS